MEQHGAKLRRRQRREHLEGGRLLLGTTVLCPLLGRQVCRCRVGAPRGCLGRGGGAAVGRLHQRGHRGCATRRGDAPLLVAVLGSGLRGCASRRGDGGSREQSLLLPLPLPLLLLLQQGLLRCRRLAVLHAAVVLGEALPADTQLGQTITMCVYDHNRMLLSDYPGHICNRGLP